MEVIFLSPKHPRDESELSLSFCAAPSLPWHLILSSLEVSDVLSPGQLFPGSTKVQLVGFGPRGIFGIIVSRVEVLSNFLRGKLRRGSPAQAFQERREGRGRGYVFPGRARQGH